MKKGNEKRAADKHTLVLNTLKGQLTPLRTKFEAEKKANKEFKTE